MPQEAYPYAPDRVGVLVARKFEAVAVPLVTTTTVLFPFVVSDWKRVQVPAEPPPPALLIRIPLVPPAVSNVAMVVVPILSSSGGGAGTVPRFSVVSSALAPFMPRLA